mgnify:CR=1 FL=1
MQVVSAKVAAQQLRRYRQRIVSRLRSLRAKLTFPQQLSHSRNFRVILRESILEYENALVHMSVRCLHSPYPKKYCFISEIPPSLSQNHS